MPAARKRENRENQFYNVGEQGRKTGITIEDKGVRDEYGMEPISGIFSSPAKAPASARQTDGTMTTSESMDIQDSSIPDLTPGHMLRNSRTNFPPPPSRSPKKTALGSSPRRPASMGPRATSVARVLDFDQEDSSLQETPALSGSGARRGRPRRDVYDLDESPVAADNTVVEESLIQEEITANGELTMFDGAVEESFAGAVGEDSMAGAYGDGDDVSKNIENIAESLVEEPVEEPTEEPVEEPFKIPKKKGRKRKSDALEPAAEQEPSGPKSKKQDTTLAKASAVEKAKKTGQQPVRRSKRVSEATAEDLSTVEEVADAPIDDTVQEEEQAAPPPVKRRGRPPKNKAAPSNPVTAEAEAPVFKKPKTIAKPKPIEKAAAKQKATEKPAEKKADKSVAAPGPTAGTLVDAMGRPLSKQDVDQLSTTTTGSRFGRGRQLSIFRQLGPEEFGKVRNSGRRHLPPLDFWKNERVEYAKDGSMRSVLHTEFEEENFKKNKPGRKGKRRSQDEDEEKLERWEATDGVLAGACMEFDPATETTSEDLVEETIAWAQKGVKAVDVPSGEFKFVRLAGTSPNPFFSFGCIVLDEDGHKRQKNSRKMHMVFHVVKGSVEVTVHQELFTIHKGGIWQVPRGNTYSIKNINKGESRIFFAQASE